MMTLSRYRMDAMDIDNDKNPKMWDKNGMIRIQSNRETAPKVDTQKLKQAKETLFSRDDLGYLHLPDRMSEWEAAQQHAKRIQSISKKQIVIGMGGSSLGGKCISQVLRKSAEQIEFWDSTDPIFLRERFDAQRSPKDTHWIVISKSGSTLETLSIVNFVNAKLEELNLNLFDQLTIVTEDSDSPLADLAKKNDIPVIPHAKDVGGRFSALSVVGLLPAALVGADLSLIREGAKLAKEQASFAIELATQILSSLERNESVSIIWPYDYRLKGFSRWTQQLWAESLGKKQKRDGSKAPHVSTPIYCLGSREQHSILQQIMEGQKDKLLIFLTQKSDKAKPLLQTPNLFHSEKHLEDKSPEIINSIEAQACIEATKQNDISTVTLEYDFPNEKMIGYLLFGVQLTIGILGEYLDVNAYDQPGVELGKRIAKEQLLLLK